MRSAIIYGRRRQGKSTLSLSLAVIAGRTPVIIYDPCDQYTSYPRYNMESVDAVMESEAVIRVVPDDPYDDFDRLMEILDGGEWYWSDYTLVIDEASMLQRPQSAHPSLLRLIRQAPDDVTVIQTIHRPSESHPTVRALTTDIFFFQTYLYRDLSVIRDTWGDDVSQKVSRLPQHHVLHFWLDRGGLPCHTTWDNPSLWYMPIQRAYVEVP